MAKEGAQVFGEAAESVVTALARGLVFGMHPEGGATEALVRYLEAMNEAE